MECGGDKGLVGEWRRRAVDPADRAGGRRRIRQTGQESGGSGGRSSNQRLWWRRIGD
jgi:hypothetical protein